MQWNLLTHICTHTHSHTHTSKELIKSWNMLHAKQQCEPSADSIRRTRFCCEKKKEREGREMKRERKMLARETRWKNVNKRGALTVKWKIIIDQLAQRCKKDIWSCEWRQYANMQHSIPHAIYHIQLYILYIILYYTCPASRGNLLPALIALWKCLNVLELVEMDLYGNHHLCRSINRFISSLIDAGGKF